ncbi:MAG: signal peptidase I [Patescibacteria group bacterium]|nr:signal peptidase I [Patescibacteria group bacterium]
MSIVIRKIAKFITIFVITLAVGLVVAAAFPWKNGLRLYTVLSGSMEPTIKTGSLIIAQQTPPEEIRINDIIAFRDPNDIRRVLVHRVISISNGNKQDPRLLFKTKGDANNIADSKQLQQSLIIGRVNQAIPYLGYFLSFIRQPIGILIFLIIPCLIIAVVELRNFKIHLNRHYMKKMAKEIEEKI